MNLAVSMSRFARSEFLSKAPLIHAGQGVNQKLFLSNKQFDEAVELLHQLDTIREDLNATV